MNNVKIFFISIIIVIAALFGNIYAEDDPFADMESVFDSRMKKMGERFDENFNKMSDTWDLLMKEEIERWDRLQREVEQKWDELVEPAPKIWLKYDDKKDTRSVVDFEKGEIEITTIVEPEDKKAEEKAKERIVKTAQDILTGKNEIKEEVLKGQIQDSSGKPVTKNNVKNFIEKEVKVTKTKKSYVAKDGKKRVKYTVKIKMIPGHLEKRAERYKRLVKKYAREFNIDVRLVFAVIQTESYFNPMARSHIPAFGLMQLVPNSGAKDAYRFIYKKDKTVSASYLYKPENNIRLGAAYLHLLKNKYFNKVEGDTKRLYLMISAYNWGPGSVRRKIVEKRNLSKMTDSELYNFIIKVAADETKDYLKRVTKRIPLYEKYL